MKSLLVLALLLTLSISTAYPQTPIQPTGGNGHETNPFQIASLENLYWVTASTTRWRLHYIQVADIDASETSSWFSGEGWKPIGSYINHSENHPFTGSYNGQGYTIVGLYINRPNSGATGLFGFINESRVENTYLANVDMTGASFTGGLAGLASLSHIENCHITGEVKAEGFITDDVGGLVGRFLTGRISFCSSNVNVITNAQYRSNSTGGLIGLAATAALITSCHSSGTVSGSKMVGGLIGYLGGNSSLIFSQSSAQVTGVNQIGGLIGTVHSMFTATITNNYSSGSVIGVSEVGGLVGLSERGILEKSFSSGTVSGEVKIGGLVGSLTNSSEIELCSSSSSVNGTSEIGGLVGHLTSGSKIQQSYSMGNVNGNSKIGGLVGIFANSTIRNSHSKSVVQGSWDNVGGLIGSRIGGTIIESYWDTITSRQAESDGGYGRTPDEMTYPYADNTYVNWDFVRIWRDDTDYSVNNGYPYHFWQQGELPPQVTTIRAQVQGPSDINVVGKILDFGSSPIEAHGICWAFEPNPTLEDNHNDIGAAHRPVTFFHLITDIPYGKILFVRAYATNNYGTTYGEQLAIVAGSLLPPDGSGTEQAPFLISSKEDLCWLSHTIAHWNRHFLQTTDIDLSGLDALIEAQIWLPIGTFQSISIYDGFRGHYDGQNHSIKGFVFNKPEMNGSGLFRVTNGATIKNLNLENTEIEGKNYVGSIVGFANDTTIINCSSTGKVKGNDYIGGLIGYALNTTVTSSFTLTTTSGLEYVGGLVGLVGLESDINNSYTRNIVSGNNSSGGLIGRFSEESVVENCFSSSVVSGSGSGGLIGSRDTTSTIINSYWDIEMSGQDSSAGGEGRTTEEMTYPYSENTYIGWNFTEIWVEDDDYTQNDGYPFLTELISSVSDDEIDSVPSTTALFGNYPNPFNPATTISFSLAEAGEVSLEIYNLRGQRVKTLVSEHLQPGYHQIVWNGKNENGKEVSSGVYFYALRTNDTTMIRKMMVIK